MAQCIIFFFAGYDTLSTTIGFMVHELAVNVEIQNRLIEEIDTIRDGLNGESLNYNCLQKMKYLDMVVCESMRRWSAVTMISRLCTKPTSLEIAEGKSVQINVGDAFWIPVYAIHMDEKTYPNPEKFDPERFSDANSGNIGSHSYLPFGTGPRNCIGSRFALMEIKSILYHLLSSVRFEVCDKTQVPIRLAKDSFFLIPEKGYYINICKREV